MRLNLLYVTEDVHVTEAVIKIENVTETETAKNLKDVTEINVL